uniref:Uncharacterized protein n=1 Tax=Cryptosporidium parvum TaxID=5807 RepID=F0X578_CRYPV
MAKFQFKMLSVMTKINVSQHSQCCTEMEILNMRI